MNPAAKQTFREHLKRPLVFFDLETTGIDVQLDRIVEFAAVRYNLDGSEPDLTMLINPECAIPLQASEIHGIKDADVKGAPKFSEAVEEIMTFIKDCDLGGFNVRRFDVPLLQAELTRCGKSLDFKSLHIVDACDIFHKREPRSLEGAMRFYCQEEHEKAHQALADVHATVKVFEAQLQKYKDLPFAVDELHAMFFDKDSVDLGGKLRWIGSDITINFGKHKGTPMKMVPQNYLLWMKKNGVVGADASEIIERALNREFPRRITPEDK